MSPEHPFTAIPQEPKRMEAVGITPLAAAPALVEPKVPAKPSTAPVSAFERGVAAPGGQYKSARAL
ncbi:hypothetical protein [Streptomyces exfoliatus]|uniref:hypothetical protein n=1 Tax=Streptomyces exfoliatus TaxID=1905 RepID=UPI0037892FAB